MRDYQAAAVGHSTRFRSIGIDAEPDEPLPEGVLEEICLPAERALLRGTADLHADRLLFSAKEAVYKTWFPRAGRWLGFDEALVMLRSDGTFDVDLLVAGPVASSGPLAGSGRLDPHRPGAAHSQSRVTPSWSTRGSWTVSGKGWIRRPLGRSIGRRSILFASHSEWR